MHYDWVVAHSPEAPPGLLDRVRAVLDANPGWEPLPLSEALLLAGRELLELVLRAERGDSREVALDLLSADACVTWAFEAAADQPRDLGALAETGMQQIAEVAG